VPAHAVPLPAASRARRSGTVMRMDRV
jgi:hypothetical protein